ncbi:MAG: SigE family RNA polymerase sigma factor [Mycobacteriales bacterium]
MDEHAREAFRGYVAARSPALLRTAYLLTGQRADAEDLLQTALAKTYLAWDRIREREALDSYVRRVMVNTQTSRWRRRKVDEYPTETLPERAGGRDAADDIALHDALWEALRGLPTRQRAMLVLRFYEDLSEADTAELMGVSAGTVKSTTSRALAKLRDHPGLRDEPRAALPFDGVPA